MRFQVSKRYSRLLYGFVAISGLIFFFNAGLVHRHNNPHPYPQVLLTPSNNNDLPPLFEAYTEYEDHLPQQLDEFTERKYIFMANYPYGCGWGNVLQNIIYTSLVASESGRGYVWFNYTWNRDGLEYSDFNGKKIPSRVPISTMLSGYILGLNSGNRDFDVTRPIPRTLYERICPREDRVYIDKTSVEAHRQLNPANTGTSLNSISGKAVLDAWVDKLNQPDIKDARCVEVLQDTPQVFDIWVFGTPRLHDLWDTVVKSPILADWSWSPLVYQAFDRNRNVISPKSFWPRLAASKGTETPDTLPVLTIHLRRGDYAEHCINLAGWDSTYTGQNSFPEFLERDAFVTPKVIEGHSSGSMRPDNPPIVSSEDEKIKYYAKHCYPDITQVVERVREVVHDYELFVRNRSAGGRKYEDWGSKTRQKRSTGRKSVGNKLLNRIFIMTNGDRELLQEMKQALMTDAERSKIPGETNGWEFEWTWKGISTSRDLELGWEEKPVGQALDMYIAQRSELFVGNGFSSLTGNIVMLRMKDGRDPLQIRFW